MTGPLDPQSAYTADPTMGGIGYGSPYGMGVPFGVPLYNLPDFKRQAAFEAMTDAGLSLIKASAPSPYPVDGATLFGALAGGAAQGGRDASQRYMQRAMMAGQIRNLALQNQMYPAALKALNSPSQYDPYGGQGGAPQPQAQPDSGAVTAGAPNDNNIGNVKTPDLKGFAQVPDFNSGVKLAADTVRGYGNGKTIAQIGATYAPPSENNTDAWVKNVASISGLDPNKPLDLTDPQTAAALVRGIHGAEKGGSAIQPLANYLPGVTGKFTPVQYSPQQGQPAPQGMPPGQPQGAPQFPGNPPDPSKYNALRMLGGQWAKQADALYERDKQRYEAAKNLYGARLEGANKPVDAAGNVNPAVIAATSQKAQAEEAAKEQGRVDYLFGPTRDPNWDKLPPEQRLARLPESVRGAVAGIGPGGDMAVSDLPARSSGGPLGASRNDIVSLARSVYGDKMDVRLGEQRKEFEDNMLKGSAPEGATRLALNTGFQHLDVMQDLIVAQENHDTPTVNRILKAWNDQTGNPRFTSAEALQKFLAPEVAKVVKGGGQLNETEVEDNKEQLAVTKSWAQARDILQTWKGAMLARKHTLDETADALQVPASRKSTFWGPSMTKAIGHMDTAAEEADKARAARAQQMQGQPGQSHNVPAMPQREVGKTYQTPKGPYIWTGQGWRAP